MQKEKVIVIDVDRTIAPRVIRKKKPDKPWVP